MALDDLLETIETLRGRIEAHGPALRKSETLTRYALIDPLLRALGWDTSDPAQVVPEYPSSGGRADYALLASGTPKMMVEAKKLGEQMHGAVSQGINYCLEKGTLYFTVTNGQVWEIYETHKPVPVEQKRIVEFDVTGSPAEACLKALALWRQGVVEGNIKEGEAPVVGDDPLPAPETAEPGTLQRQPEPDPLPPPPDGREPWVRLSELRVEAHRKPAWLLPPSGGQVSTPSWTAFVAQLAQWLVNVGRLSGNTSPIQVGKRYVLAQEPTHPDGKAFTRVQRAGPLYIETNYSGADTVRNARLILERAEMQPRDFRVRLAE